VTADRVVTPGLFDDADLGDLHDRSTIATSSLPRTRHTGARVCLLTTVVIGS
jgi:hypothetical protein